MDEAQDEHFIVNNQIDKTIRANQKLPQSFVIKFGNYLSPVGEIRKRTGGMDHLLDEGRCISH